MGTLASYKEPRVHSQKHEHMTTFEVGEQRTYTEQASAGTGSQTFPGVTCHGASSALLSRSSQRPVTGSMKRYTVFWTS